MISFIRLQEEHLEQVLAWRTKESVSQYMFTDVNNNIENQRKWYERISNSPTERYWLILIKDKPAGVISLNALDRANKRTSWGYYIGEDEYTLYGGLIPPHFYNYVFHELKLNKITAEIMAGNDNIMKLHRMHGYRDVGVYKEHIYKYGQYHDIFIMELLKEQWVTRGSKYAKYTASFE